MTKQKAKTKLQTGTTELDSVFFLKVVLYLIVGSQWIRFGNGAGNEQIPIPVGLLIGLLFAVHEHFTIDRRIEFAILLIAMLIGFWAQAGIFITY